MKKVLLFVFVALIAIISCSKKEKETEPEMSKDVSVVSVTSNSIEVLSAIDSDGGLALMEYGFCYSQTQEPTIENEKVSLQKKAQGEYSMKISDLKPATTYYVRAYAINKVGVGYSETITITTEEAEPQMSSETGTTESVTQTSANVSYVIASDGGASITEKGFCYSTKENPTIADTKVTVSGSNLNMTATLIGLKAGTTYYVRAYATNSKGTSYGEQIIVKTSAAVPTVTTSSVSNITTTSATVGGNVTSDGGASVTARGVCWATTTYPTISNSKETQVGSGTGTFTTTIYGLEAATTYYIRAYATNSKGTSYGEQITFKTSYPFPIVTTSSASNITTTSATLGGNVTSDGGPIVTERGVCWATTTNPTISNSKKEIGSGTGTFSATIGDLNPNTTYYVRAYAIGGKYTSYGNVITIKTSISVGVTTPTVTTTLASNVTRNSATLGGNVISDGGASVTERGVCWALVPNYPDNSYPHKVIGSGTGPFSATITNLKEGNTYNVRAYAINSQGTSFGEFITLKTQSPDPSDIVNGAIQAAFTVSNTKQVYFSQGNLQYQASTKTWRFAEHQYDIIGSNNKNISSTYSGWIDLFGWGTSGYSGGAKAYQPYSTSTSMFDYGVGRIDGVVHNNVKDWGYNAILNGGNRTEMWRTLEADEWKYMLNIRVNANALKGSATVNGIEGLVLLPDNWTMPDGVTFKSGMNGFDKNTYSTSDWAKMEANGAVFLPCAGTRSGTQYSITDDYYWSWTIMKDDYYSCSADVLSIAWTGGSVGLKSLQCSTGCSVRLVKDVK